MDCYNYLIIGGGMASDAAVRGIRELDMSGRIGIVSQEEFPPYARPPLTKSLWYGKKVEDIWLKTERENVVMHLNATIKSVVTQEHIAEDVAGKKYKYEKLLLATGGLPRKLNCPDESVLYFRTLHDFYNVKELYDKVDDFILIGAGFIGTELASALAMNGKKVTLIFKEPTLQCQRFPKKFSSFLSAYFTEKEVQLVPKESVVAVTKRHGRFRVKTHSGSEYDAGAVIAALGIEPNIQLAQNIGLNLDNGVKVNGLLQTNQTDIWAAGDTANFYTPLLEKRMRMEHEDAATSMGKQAGRNMAGAHEDYSYLPYFYSDIFELGYEAIGELSADLEIIEQWKDLNREGAIFYLKEGKLRGAAFFNIWNQIPHAREMIASQLPFSQFAKI
jgi:3-phenylpropionate/trans-cinnamate dioxygenase ferredoxin reductase subunit